MKGWMSPQPAALTRMSMRGCFASTAAAVLRILALSARLMATNSTATLVCFASFPTSTPFFSSTSAQMTVAPQRASSINVALPMPEAPPVTIETLPFNFIVPLHVSSVSTFRLYLRGMPGCVAAFWHHTAKVGWSLNRAYFALLIFVPFLPWPRASPMGQVADVAGSVVETLRREEFGRIIERRIDLVAGGEVVLGGREQCGGRLQRKQVLANRGRENDTGHVSTLPSLRSPLYRGSF